MKEIWLMVLLVFFLWVWTFPMDAVHLYEDLTAQTCEVIDYD